MWRTVFEWEVSLTTLTHKKCSQHFREQAGGKWCLQWRKMGLSVILELYGYWEGRRRAQRPHVAYIGKVLVSSFHVDVMVLSLRRHDRNSPASLVHIPQKIVDAHECTIRLRQDHSNIPRFSEPGIIPLKPQEIAREYDAQLDMPYCIRRTGADFGNS